MTSELPWDRPSSRRHLEVLAVAIGVVALAALMEVRDDERVAFRGWMGYPAPELCLARSWFGGSCPGCGLTRGMIDLAHADWAGATARHRLSFLMAFAILAQVPYRIYCLSTGRLPFGTRWPRLFGACLIGALAINWVVDVATGLRGAAGPSSRAASGPRPGT